MTAAHLELDHGTATDTIPPRLVRGIDLCTAPLAALVLRFALGAVFIAHGLFKLLVLTLPGTAAFFEAHGFPGWTVYPVFVVELVGGFTLVAGMYARWAALALLPVVFRVHGPLAQRLGVCRDRRWVGVHRVPDRGAGGASGPGRRPVRAWIVAAAPCRWLTSGPR